jgi:hypothetical protein
MPAPQQQPEGIVFTISKRKPNGKQKKTNLSTVKTDATSVVLVSLDDAQLSSTAPPPKTPHEDDGDDDVVVFSRAEEVQQPQVTTSSSVAAVNQIDPATLDIIAAATSLSAKAIPFFPSFAQPAVHHHNHHHHHHHHHHHVGQHQHPQQFDDRYYERITHETHRAFQQNGHVVADDNDYEMDPDAYGDENGNGNIFMYEDEELDSDQEAWLLEQMIKEEGGRV